MLELVRPDEAAPPGADPYELALDAIRALKLVEKVHEFSRPASVDPGREKRLVISLL